MTVIQAAVMLRKFQLTDNGFGSRLAAAWQPDFSSWLAAFF
ncbi:hypothetical protein ACIA4D_08270 [Lactobacillus delbrueckii subsp. bulgaricus]